MPAPSRNDDPAPAAPSRPDNDECCHSGCTPCIFDLYEDDMERYRLALKAWEERRGLKGKTGKR